MWETDTYKHNTYWPLWVSIIMIYLKKKYKYLTGVNTVYSAALDDKYTVNHNVWESTLKKEITPFQFHPLNPVGGAAASLG